MQGIQKALFILVAGCLLASSSIAYNWSSSSGGETPAATLVLSPATVTLQEGESIRLQLSFTIDGGPPLSTAVSWNIYAAGDRGSLHCPSTFNDSGQLTATYEAPADVDVHRHNVTLEARTTWLGNTFLARAQCVVLPRVHKTNITVSAERRSMTAGETVTFTATLRGRHDEGWRHLAGQPLSWIFFEASRGTLQPLIMAETKTSGKGRSTVPFFISDVNETTEVRCLVQMADNLTGNREYEGCAGTASIKVQPETPGMYPVVFIHGWFGSMTEKLLQTWSNLTEKLQRHGYTILDFDTSLPGIQYLRYSPGWADHHIPWMAGKVNDAIKQALVDNGYSPNQTIDIVTHSMGGLVARFLAEHPGADVDYWNNSWQPGDPGKPWHGDGDADISIGPRQIDDLFMVGTMNHGIPPNLDERFLKRLDFIPLPWWTCQMQDMVYRSKFLEAMGYRGSDLVDYYAIGSDIGFRIGEPRDFDGDGVAHTTDGLVPTESPYLEGCPLYIVTGKARPNGDADHNSQIAINDDIHQYIITHLACFCPLPKPDGTASPSD
ncbi:MAG: hypothetical protein R6U10_05045 [Thermoplasmatota archaeon]